MIRNGRDLHWCKQHYHHKPMWYPCNNCFTKANFKKRIDLDNKGKMTATEYFKFSLVAFRSEENYESFKGQFLN